MRVYRIGLVVCNLAGLALMLAPWTKVNGEPYSALRMASEFSFADVYMLIGMILVASVLGVGKRGALPWVGLLLQLVSVGFVFYVGFSFEQVSQTNEMGLGGIGTLMALMVGALFALVLSFSTEFDSEGGFSKALTAVSGQSAYVKALEQASQMLGARYSPRSSALSENTIEGRVADWEFAILDYCPFGPAVAIKALRIAVRCPDSMLSFLFVTPTGSKMLNNYLGMAGKGKSAHPLSVFLDLPNVEVPGVLGKGWAAKWGERQDASRISKVATSIVKREDDLKSGWIVAEPGELYFESTFMMRPKYSAAQMVSIVNLLVELADVFGQDQAEPI